MLCEEMLHLWELLFPIVYISLKNAMVYLFLVLLSVYCLVRCKRRIEFSLKLTFLTPPKLTMKKNSTEFYFSVPKEDPEFTDQIENVTVAAGRSVKLACSVKNLGTYKVRIQLFSGPLMAPAEEPENKPSATSSTFSYNCWLLFVSTSARVGFRPFNE